MKTVWLVTPDPSRPDLGHDAFERREEAVAEAKLRTRVSGVLHYAVLVALQLPAK